METVYRAKDGTIFETEVRCREHESQVAVELFFDRERISTAPGFRTAIIQFKDYVKNVLGSLDTVTQEEVPTEKADPAFVPVFSEEKERERDHESAKEAIEEYFVDWDITDRRDLDQFFMEHKVTLAAYFGFKL